jgi:hypothetical protein
MRHPDAAAKIGPGIARIEIRKDPFFKQNVFWIIRADGSETDFSFRRCINGAEPSHRAQVLATMRLAITDQVLDYKHRALTPDARCSLTGVPLDETNVHVDHDPPFIEIARAFLAKVGGVAAVELAPPRDGILGRTFLDPLMAQRWSDFHRARATLFLTSAKANMGRGAKKVFIRRIPFSPDAQGEKG